MSNIVLSGVLPANQVATPVMVLGQKLAYCGVGLCDPSMTNSVNSLKVFRYQKFLVPWTLAADGSPLILAANQSIVLFSVGNGDSGAALGIWWQMTTADTDVFSTGYLPARGQFLIVTGLAFQVLDVYQRGGTTGVLAATDPQVVNAFLRQREFGYIDPMAQATLSSFNGVFTFGDSGQQFRTGLLIHYPSYAAVVDGSPRNGNITAPIAFTPLAIAICAGPKDNEKQVTLTLTNSSVARQVMSNAIAPTSITANTRTDATTVFQECIVHVYGIEMCLQDPGSCGPLTIAEQQLVYGGQGPIVPNQPVGPQQGNPQLLTAAGIYR